MTERSVLVREGERLGLRLPRSAWKAAGHNASAALRQSGRLVSRDRISDWQAQELCQLDDDIICYGPGFVGSSLEELLHSQLNEETLIQRLAVAAQALNRLNHETGERATDQASLLSPGIRSLGVLVSENDEVLILPPALVSRARTAVPGGDEPRQTGNAAVEASVMLASFLRRLFLLRLPGEAGVDVELDSEIGTDSAQASKHRLFVPLGLIAPQLDPVLASLADRALARNSGIPSLDEWAAAFGQAGKTSCLRQLSPDELAGIELRRKAAETRIRKKIARGRFMAKRGGLLATAAVTALVIAGIAVFDRPPPGPDLSDLEPEALVASYYQAMDSLDLDSLEACLEGKAGKDDKTLVTNLTIVIKMRQAYARNADFISAAEWVATGSPELADGALMYGLTGLEIRSLDLPGGGRITGERYSGAQAPEPQPALGGPPAPAEAAARQNTPDTEQRFEARYTLWTTESADEGIRAIHETRTDRLVLSKGRQGWKITAIEREKL